MLDDVMCYGDKLIYRKGECASSWGLWIDCAGLTYWNLKPRAGSWLARNPGANVALSPYLEPFSGPTQIELVYVVASRSGPGELAFALGPLSTSHRREIIIPLQCDFPGSWHKCKHPGAGVVKITVQTGRGQSDVLLPIPPERATPTPVRDACTSVAQIANGGGCVLHWSAPLQRH